jgi:restriction system protein
MPKTTSTTRNTQERRVALRLSTQERGWFSQQWTLEDMLALGNNGVEFERFVGYLYQQEGYEVWTTSRTGDHGVDLFLTKAQRSYVVQCKQYAPSHKVQPKEARDLGGVMLREKADYAFFVTTSTFTNQTKEWANTVPMMLIEGPQLLEMATRVHRRTMGQPVSLGDWVNLVVERVGQFFQWPIIGVASIGAGLMLMLILLFWLPALFSGLKPNQNAVAARITFPPGSSGNITPASFPTVMPAAFSPPPTATTAPPPTSTPRVKNAESSPCYVGQIKGNTQTKFYHKPGWYYYKSFPPDSPIVRCFDTEQEAKAAGYNPGKQ